MHVILFTWEYPPRIVGKLAEYVSTLSSQLIKNNVQTNVVTYHDTMTGESEESNGVKVVRVNNPVHTHVSVLTWSLTLNQEVERVTANIYYQAGKHIDLIEVNDWHFLPAAVTLKNALNISLVYNVDSLEDHRTPGANSPLNMAIRGIEWLGFYEAKKVTVKTEWMQDEVMRIYNVPKEKIKIISGNDNASVKSRLAVYREVAAGAARP